MAAGTAIEDRIKVSRQQRRRSDRVTLLQISDLHFTSKTRTDPADQELFLSHFEDLLDAHLRREGTAIDLVLVTGDLIDNASDLEDRNVSLGLCRQYLHDLCVQRLGLVDPAESMIVIPGNHDYRWFGLDPCPSAKETFQTAFQEHLNHALFPNLDLFIGCFDSNVALERVEWARGWVDPRTFPTIQDLVKSLPQEDRDSFRSARRLALVHHHPMPVPTSEERQQSWSERFWFGKRMHGAVEHMLLKNSGTFLHQALRLGFQAVFHGHFHRQSFWRTVTDTPEGSRSIEVFGCRSLGSAAEERYGFNLITLYNENDISVLPFAYSASGLLDQGRPVRSANYEEVQSSRWRPSQRRVDGKPATSFASKDHLIKWDVDLPSGTLITRELIRELEVQSGALEELRFPLKATALTRETFEAWLIEDGKQTPLVVESSEGEPDSSGSLRIIHTVLFQPALTAANSPTSLKIKRVAEGVIFINLADARAWGNTGRLDHCTRRLMISTRHLSIRLSIDAVDRMAPSVSALVFQGSSTAPAQRELDSERVNVLSWDDPKGATTVNWDMSVDLPVTGHCYGFKWLVPSAPTDSTHANRIVDMRSRFWSRIASKDRRAVSTSARKLLDAFLDQSEMPTTGAECALFGWVGPELRREAEGPLLSTFSPRWGRDLAGAAFRMGLPIRFNRDAALGAHAQACHHVPAKVHALVASPLGTFDKAASRYRTVLVLVFAASSRDDGLTRLSERNREATEFDVQLRKFWQETLKSQPYTAV